MLRIYILTGVLLFSTLLSAQSPNLGTSGAQFLKIPLGATESGMAGAVVGLTGGASSLFWNPAGIAKTQGVDLNFTYMKWFDLFDMNAASVVYNVGDMGVLGFSAISFSTNQIEITNEESPNGTGQYYDASDIAIGVSYARYLTNAFNVGFTIKYVNQSIWHESASGVAVDIGTQYKLDFQNLTIAMSMTNFGSSMQYSGADLQVREAANASYPKSRLAPADLSTSSYALPLSFQVGLGFDIYKSEFLKIIGGIDAVHPNDNYERLQFGSQISAFDRFFLRGGYIYHHDTQNFAFGAGANVPAGNTKIEFSYSYSHYKILPAVHRISCGINIF